MCAGIPTFYYYATELTQREMYNAQKTIRREMTYMR